MGQLHPKAAAPEDYSELTEDYRLRRCSSAEDYSSSLAANPKDYRELEEFQNTSEVVIKAHKYEKAWFVENATSKRHLKYKTTENGRERNATGVLSKEGTIIIVKGKKRRGFYKVLCFFKGVTFFNVGVEFDSGSGDLKQVIHHGSDALSSLMNNMYGMKGQKWGLSLIMRADLVKIRTVKDGTRGYVPEAATADDGNYRLTAMLTKELASEMAYLVFGNSYYWLPGDGLNVFEVKKEGDYYTFSETDDRPSRKGSRKKYKKCRLEFNAGVEGPKQKRNDKQRRKNKRNDKQRRKNKRNDKQKRNGK